MPRGQYVSRPNTEKTVQPGMRKTREGMVIPEESKIQIELRELLFDKPSQNLFF